MQQSSVLSLSSSKPILPQAQVSGIPPGSPPKSSQTPPWSSHSISVTSTKSTQLPPAFDAYQKLESAPNQRCMVIHSSEGSSARKRLIVNVDCQSHRTLQHQDRADRHNHAMCRPEPVHTHTHSGQQQSRATPSRDPATASFRNDQTLKRNSTTLRTSRMSHKVTTLARHHSRALVWSHNHIPRRSFVSLWAGGRRRSRWDKPECNVYPG